MFLVADLARSISPTSNYQQYHIISYYIWSLTSTGFHIMPWYYSAFVSTFLGSLLMVLYSMYRCCTNTTNKLQIPVYNNQRKIWISFKWSWETSHLCSQVCVFLCPPGGSSKKVKNVNKLQSLHPLCKVFNRIHKVVIFSSSSFQYNQQSPHKSSSEVKAFRSMKYLISQDLYFSMGNWQQSIQNYHYWIIMENILIIKIILIFISHWTYLSWSLKSSRSSWSSK